MSDVAMPRLSDSMEEGTIVRWLKADGDQVSRGDELVEIETDKATMTYEADQDGVLDIVAGEGETLVIGEVIAHIGEPSGDGAAPAGGGEERKAAAAPPREPEPAPTSTAGNGGERVKASPVARRIARDRGVELSRLTGSGPGGRIVKADVESAVAQAAPSEPAPRPAAEPAPTATAKGEVESRELSRSQRTIARRMAESRATVPDFTLETEIDMEAALEARSQLREVARDQPVPTLNDMIVKASALALREFPRANGSYSDGRFELHSRVNVGVAVATNDSLVVPTVFDADRKGLGEIARETRALAEKVREGDITPPEVSGGTFTVSNLGMYGITSFTAVINPPQAAILSVGSVQPRAVVRDGDLVARRLMRVTLACDHRILYGADAAEFLARIRELLEHPAALGL
ncbi:MAG TPA: dihydrolipoamide acetyltransferase family protein [Solirubrobacteraceae bacterium]|jgi:pyruvate dehydrogenase E2 component (dihydrolipoamide acetyltransferase)|nr:dihydrolipoamide acetyltransferase family protein [Solirubrobacteraceae bacterium]